MRVIAGKYGGRKIEMVPNESTKETSDKVRGAVFNSLGNQIYDAVILDLFSGSGAYGIEGLSRGAGLVYLVDHHKDAIKTIEKNIVSLGITKDVYVIQKDYLSALKMFEEKGLVFDLVFLDPPYHNDYYKHSILALEKLTNKDSVIVCELHKTNELEDVIGDFECYKEKVYGIKKIKYYHRKAL